MRNFSLKQKALFAFGIAGLSASILTGCNVYSLIDKPSGDEQILSKARACFDQADYSCAREYYAQLSPSYADVRASEEAFMILAENGATMAAFMETFGSGGGGGGLTQLAERLAPGSETKRLAIQEAYNKFDYDAVGASTDSTKQLVRFVAATALAAELLSEKISSGSLLLKTMITGAGCNSTTACAAGIGDVAGSESCNNVGNGILANGADTPIDLAASLSGAITLDHFKATMTEMYDALEKLSASGGFSSGSQGLADTFQSLPVSSIPKNQCFRATLLDQGIGR
jgi:hypothetical protein